MKNEFTFFRVPDKQTGNLMQYRGQIVIMICINREKFNHFLKVYPVEINEKQLEEIVKKVKFKKYLYYFEGKQARKD